MQEMENKDENLENVARIYELGYLFIPTISEEELGGVYTTLKDLIVEKGGAIIMDEIPKMIPLAYEMRKVTNNIRSRYDSAYFGWVKFEMDSEKVADLKKAIDLNDNMLRYLITKTVRENTIATKKFVFKDAPKRRSKKEEGAEPVEINKEEIDKEIDAMVAE